MEEGKPIWIESLLTPKEYGEMAKLYPKSYTSGKKPVQEFECDFKWRKDMGAVMAVDRREKMNNNLDYIMAHAGVKQEI